MTWWWSVPSQRQAIGWIVVLALGLFLLLPLLTLVLWAFADRVALPGGSAAGLFAALVGLGVPQRRRRLGGDLQLPDRAGRHRCSRP